MRGAFLIIFFLSGMLISRAQCGFALRDKLLPQIGGATFMKDFRVSLEEGNEKKPPKEEFGILLNKGTHYRFNIQADSLCEDQVVLRLYDHDRHYGGNYDPDDGTSYRYFDFFCAKTQIYFLSVSFAKGKKGCAVAIVSFVDNYKAD